MIELGIGDYISLGMCLVACTFLLYTYWAERREQHKEQLEAQEHEPMHLFGKVYDYPVKNYRRR